ncbi:fimbrial protein [Serratia silvae]|uniref:Type 1 fimbrial protein n=1 Tax=Serratia silvae TaxID=2824122 RepID=A0ABT0KAC1_9GAMM|nr:fimbrial protein [Serratia silvae]MCL1028989.1 type 1 fimbrial protein [Serratia silvae]
MKHSLFAITTLATSLFSASVLAEAPPGSQGNGQIAFSGSVLKAPCGLAPGVDGDNQSIDLGQTSDAQLKTVGYATPKEFKIKLIGCTFDDTAEKDTVVNVRFDGASVGGTNGLLGVSGDAKGLAIRLLDSGNKPVKVGTKSQDYTLHSGDNTLLFSAQVVALQGETIVAGNYDALTSFALTYL